MFFEKLIKSDFEQFIGQEVFSVTNLESTSFATNGSSMYLVKTIKNGKLVRHYADDFCWYEASDVYNVKDCSYAWQGFSLAKFQGTKLYDQYLLELEEYYSKKYTYKKGKQTLIKSEIVQESLSKVQEIVNRYLNDDTDVLVYEKV